MQGLAARAAFAAARLGDLPGAVRLLEQGSAVLAGARLSQQEAVLSILEAAGHGQEVAAYRDAVTAVSAATLRGADAAVLGPLVEELGRARGVMEGLWGAPLAPQASSQDLATLVADGPLTYLAATPWGGMALTLTPDPGTATVPGIQVTWLPDLASRQVTGWVETIHGARRAEQVDDTPGGPTSTPPPSAADRGAQCPDGDAPLVGRGVWRAGSDAPTPARDAVQVTDQLAAILHPLVSGLGGAGTVRVVPVGALAMLPVGAALTRALTRHDDPAQKESAGSVGVSVAGSARLHLMTTGRANAPARQTKTDRTVPDGEGPWLVAVTNPRTCTWEGGDLPALEGASAEGKHLARRYGATVLDGPQASRDAAIDLLGRPSLRAIHLATHGDSPSWDPDRVHLLLADGTDGTAETITLGDLPALLDLESVFLASCWTGKPGQTLPDEAQSLPTALVTAGAAAVVAPLWPVYDDACHDLVVAYYKAWTAGNPPAVALAAAAQSIRRYALDNHAAGLLGDDELAAWLTTADAFTITGGTGRH